MAVAQMVKNETQGYELPTLWKALYQEMPGSLGGTKIKYVGEMIFSPKVMDIMAKGYAFLHSMKIIPSPEIPADAINEGPVKAALAEMGIKPPVVEIEALPMAAYSGK
jgi:hypothetical protein